MQTITLNFSSFMAVGRQETYGTMVKKQQQFTAYGVVMN